MITSSDFAGNVPNEFVIRARTIVVTRDAMRGSLTGLGRLLNGDIDRLAELVGPDDRVITEVGTIRDRLDGLRQGWSARSAQFPIEMRGLLAERGIIEG